jgi:hypothetical protein
LCLDGKQGGDMGNRVACRPGFSGRTKKHKQSAAALLSTAAKLPGYTMRPVIFISNSFMGRYFLYYIQGNFPKN